jgi:hypothetical protein
MTTSASPRAARAKTIHRFGFPGDITQTETRRPDASLSAFTMEHDRADLSPWPGNSLVKGVAAMAALPSRWLLLPPNGAVDPTSPINYTDIVEYVQPAG